MHSARERQRSAAGYDGIESPLGSFAKSNVDEKPCIACWNTGSLLVATSTLGIHVM